MIRSMTAFARQESRTPWGVMSWELRTVNHRYLDIALRLPEEFRGLESRLREKVGGVIRRGKVDGTLRFQARAGTDSGFTLDEALVRALLDAAGRIAQMMENPAPVSALDVLKWPGVLQVVGADVDRLQGEALALLEAALREIQETRRREGEKIRALIGQRCGEIRQQLGEVRKALPVILENQRSRLRARLDELQAGLQTGFDAARLEQELAYLAQKIDVQEEVDRITVHLEEVDRVLDRDEPVGRRLDFLMQELNREANTLGAKSVDATTTRAAVEMKVAIEQMREQVQNIE